MSCFVFCLLLPCSAIDESCVTVIGSSTLFRAQTSSCRLQAKQKWHITLDRSFPATVNLRNEAMMKEAGDFASHLRRCEKDIRTLKNATEGEL